MNGSTRSRSRSLRRGDRRRGLSLLAIVTGLFLTAAVITGGGAEFTILSFGLPALLGAVMFALAIWRGGLERFWALPRLTVATVLLAVLLPALQLVPLPHDLWSTLPGRSLPNAVLAATGQPDTWRPMTLDITETVGTLAVCLWMFGLLLALLVLDQRELRAILLLIVGLGAVHLAIGAMQFLSNGDRFVFYGVAHRGALIGFFANKNHSALFIGIAMLFGYALLAPAQLRNRPVQLAAGGVVLVIVVALIATLSRAGFAIGLLALGFAGLFPQLDRRRVNWKLLGGGLGALTLLLALVATSAAATRIFDRFGDVTGDIRQVFWARSLPLVTDYLPFGAGMGSFPRVFTVSEQIGWLRETYLNHVHNDYIELIIEAGLIGALLMLLVGVTLFRHGRWAWIDRRAPIGRWALIGVAVVVLCLLHSIVDYPLRRVAIAAMFTVGWAMSLRGTRPHSIA